MHGYTWHCHGNDFAVSSKPAEELKARGAKIAATPAEAAAVADTVITMLPSSPHVREVCQRVAIPFLYGGVI